MSGLREALSAIFQSRARVSLEEGDQIRVWVPSDSPVPLRRETLLPARAELLGLLRTMGPIDGTATGAQSEEAVNGVMSMALSALLATAPPLGR